MTTTNVAPIAMAGYTYRLLPVDEWDSIMDAFEARGYERYLCPRPETSRVVVAELDGDIVGFLFLQLVLHSEPIHIDEEHRGKVNWPHMLHILEGTMVEGSEYYAFAPNATVAGMCRAVKFTDTGWTTFKRIKIGQVT